MIPIYKPDIGQQEIDALLRAVNSGSFILGPEVESFENEFSSYVGAQCGVGVASGTDALILSLEALRIGRGDEVICPAWSFYATAEAISRVGATPVFADIDISYNIDPAKVDVTRKTKAIIAVHNYGHPADVLALQGRSVPVIVDSAQALTKHSGMIGCYSFFPSKILGCCGDGGMVVTNDVAIARDIHRLRIHGQNRRWNFEKIGYNSRLDAIQAAILRVKLKKVEAAIKRRSSLAARYTKELNGIVETPPNHIRHTWAVYTIESDRRTEIQKTLASQDIQTAVHYPTALPDLPVYQDKGDYPRARAAAKRVLSLPIYPQMTEDEQSKVIEAICNE